MKKFVGSERSNCRSLGCPGFPVEVGGAAIFMRFSLQKTSHAGLSSAASRKSGYAPNEQKIKPIESILISSVHFTLNLPQASQAARDDKGEGGASIWCVVMTTSQTLFTPGSTCRRQVRLLLMNKRNFGSNSMLVQQTAGPSTALRSGRDDNSFFDTYISHNQPSCCSFAKRWETEARQIRSVEFSHRL
jgi:hypothetical protein